MAPLKTATFTVRADVHQSARWKQAADSEGFRSVGAWLGGAADAYLKVRLKAGLPLPLAWRHGRFRVRLEDGTEPDVRGWVSPPFGIFHGSADGPIYHGSTHRYSLVHIPRRAVVATFRYAQHARTLGAELAGVWARSGGEEGDIRAGPLIERHQREAT